MFKHLLHWPRQENTMTQTTAPATGIATWNIDTAHSELTFRVRHLAGRVRGSFDEWQGTLEVDPARLTDGTANIVVEAASINTGNADRDAHLRSADFFDVEKHPTLAFASTRLERDGDVIVLTGDLTLHGVTKPVVLKGTYGGVVNDPWGGKRINFEATGRISRKEFGLAWGTLVEGVALVGDVVEIDFAIEAVRA
jgi:polyisoprenoid-binding protein YceI